MVIKYYSNRSTEPKLVGEYDYLHIISCRESLCADNPQEEIEIGVKIRI